MKKKLTKLPPHDVIAYGKGIVEAEEGTIAELADLYAEKLKTASAESYQLALFDLILHQLEAIGEELRYIHNVLASK